MIILDNKVVASADRLISITQAEYDALSDEEKLGDNAYFITDSDEDYERIIELQTLLGPSDRLDGISDGTVIGALLDLYERLGGFSFSMDPLTNDLIASHNDEVDTGSVTVKTHFSSDSEKLDFLFSILGDASELTTIGYTNIVDAIADMYERFAGLKFSPSEDKTTMNISTN